MERNHGEIKLNVVFQDAISEDVRVVNIWKQTLLPAISFRSSFGVRNGSPLTFGR